MLYEKNGEIEMKLSMKRGLVFLLILTLMSSIMPFAFADESNTWVSRAPMIEKRYSFQTEVLNNKIYTLGGFNGTNRVSTVEEYDIQKDVWTTKAHMITARSYFQTEVIDGKIYVLGGRGPSQSAITSTVEMYEPEDDSWTQKKSMSISRADFQTAVINGHIYAFGGYQIDGNTTPSVEAYNPKSDSWEAKSSMPFPRKDFQLEVVNGKVYVIGGSTSGNNNSLAIQEYDPESDNWKVKASVLVEKTGFKTEVIDNKIYIIGGGANIEEYDLATNKCSLKFSLPQGVTSIQTQVVDGKIYILGGFGNEYLDKVAVYNPIENSLRSIPPMLGCRSLFGSSLINGKIYVMGGITSASSNLTNTVESYVVTQSNPTLTVESSPNKVKVGNRFTTTVAIHNVSNIYAEDIKIDYDAERFEYLGASAKDGLKIYKEDTSTPGSVRFIVAHLGKDSGATGDKDLIELTFKAKSVGIGKVDITKGRIADNDVLEMDVAEENCGEDTIEVEANKDVNRTGEYTLLDLGIDAYYYGMQADQTDTTRFDTDVIPDGVIDDKDLTAITQSILDNSNYPFN